MTRVSVVLPVYNHEKYVVDALNSLVWQDYPDLEIICVDDGSRDASLGEVLAFAELADARVRLVPQRNQGAHVALSRGAAAATGDLLMFLNSDDQYCAGRIASFVRCWRSCGESPDFWGFSMVDFMDENGDELPTLPERDRYLAVYTGLAGAGVWVPHLLAFHNVALTSGNIVLTRSLYHRVGGFSAYRMVHDWDFALRCLDHSDPVVIPQRLYRYRLHQTNTFKSIAQEDGHREGALVKEKHRASIMRRALEEPYHRRGTPFIDFLRANVPTRVGFGTDG